MKRRCEWQGPLWGYPSDALLQRVYRQARTAIPCHGTGGASDPVLGRQRWLSRVHVEFHRRLRAEHIYVEGAP